MPAQGQAPPGERGAWVSEPVGSEHHTCPSRSQDEWLRLLETASCPVEATGRSSSRRSGQGTDPSRGYEGVERAGTDVTTHERPVQSAGNVARAGCPCHRRQGCRSSAPISTAPTWNRTTGCYRGSRRPRRHGWITGMDKLRVHFCQALNSFKGDGSPWKVASAGVSRGNRVRRNSSRGAPPQGARKALPL